MAYSYGRVYAEDRSSLNCSSSTKAGRSSTGAMSGTTRIPIAATTPKKRALEGFPVCQWYALWAVAQRDFDGDRGGQRAPIRSASWKTTRSGPHLETPKNMGVTDFHYFVDPGPTEDSYLWPIITSEPTNPLIAGTAANYFHGANRRMDDVSLITTKQDLAWIIATGPFDMNPGDTVKLTLAAIAGDDDADYYSNLWEAKKLFDARFNGPTAPPPPKLSAVAGDGRATLYWTDTPEESDGPRHGRI